MSERYRNTLTEAQLTEVAVTTRHRFGRTAPFITHEEWRLARRVFIDGLMPFEVAREAGVAPSTVYQLCRRIISRLRQLTQQIKDDHGPTDTHPRPPDRAA